MLMFAMTAQLHGERLPVRTYTVADGLLRDSVYKIRQDSRGFLWFCTVEGISRFDGYGFTNFRVEDGLPDRHVNDVLETRNGTIWISTENGLARLNPKGIRGSTENPLFTTFLPQNSNAKSFKVLFEDASGGVWAGSGEGLFRLKETDGNIELENVSLGKPLVEILPITAIIQDRRGILWIGTSGRGLFRLLPTGQTEHYTTADGLPNNLVESLLEDAKGQIWAGMREATGGLVLLSNEPSPGHNIVERVYTTKDGLPANWIPALFQSSEGRFWVATVKGLCLWQGEGGDSACRIFKSANDLCDKEIWSFAEDRDGNLWTGTQCGLKKVGRYGFTSFAEADGLSDSFNHSVFQNRAGELFVHSVSKGLFISRFDGEKFQTVKPNLPPEVKNFGWGWKQTVWQDSAGAWWIPTGEGLFRFSGIKDFGDLARAAPEEMQPGTKSENVFRLYEDSSGDIWIAVIGSPSSLLRWERASNTWSNYTEKLGFDKRLLGGTVFLEDKSGNLWIGTGSDAGESGLIRYRNGEFRVFGKEDSAPPGWTRDMFVDDAGRLWIANTTWGLLRLDDVNSDQLNFVRYTTAEGLSSMGVYCVTGDEFGRIYVGTGRGLDRLNPETGQIENFTTADGLPNSDVEVAYRDRQNVLWFLTTDGLARFQPEPERKRNPPTTLITGLRVGGEPQSISILGETEIPKLDLGSDKGQISVDFVGLGATLGEKLRYEYRLTDGDWIQTDERTVNFANLSSGNYRFEIRAVTADRIYSQPAAVSFGIAAPFWQRGWFILLAAGLVALVVYLIYRNRLARLLEMERMRTLIATDLHDDIGANLTRISLMSEVAKQKSGNGTMLSSIADIARESVSSMNDIVWAISPEHDSLLDLTRRMRQHAEDVFSFRDVDLLFSAPSSDSDLKLSAEMRRDLLLIFKETVNNAARHSECTEVRIAFTHENSRLSLEIADNGKGFDPDAQMEGNGLRSIKRRAAKLGGELKVNIENGTVVRFSLPF